MAIGAVLLVVKFYNSIYVSPYISIEPIAVHGSGKGFDKGKGMYIKDNKGYIMSKDQYLSKGSQGKAWTRRPGTGKQYPAGTFALDTDSSTMPGLVCRRIPRSPAKNNRNEN